MTYEVDWTEASEEHIARHSVTPQEVEEALAGPVLEHGHRGSVTLVLGRSEAGRYLAIATTESSKGGHYVVTARNMSLAERRVFKRRMGV